MKRLFGILIGLALASSIAAPAYADGEAADAGAEPAREWLAPRKNSGSALSASSSGTGSRAAGVILVMVAIGSIAMYFRQKRRGSAAKPAAMRIQVLGSTRIGPKAHAVVARVGGKTILLGVTDGSVRRLAWLPNDAPIAEEAIEPAPAQPVSGFKTVLRDALGMEARRPASVEPRDLEPALEIARETRDIYDRVSTRHQLGHAKTQLSPVIHVESQAAGLVARLRELKS